MTDIHHSTGFWPGTDQVRSGVDWGTGIVAVLALALVLGLPHLTGNVTYDASQLQSIENGSVQLDGRGKWTGYM